jgi:hypothetical protein
MEEALSYNLMLILLIIVFRVALDCAHHER